MGAMAEDILDGSCCALCCSYFEDPIAGKDGEHGIFVHGGPSVCSDCWDKFDKEVRELYKKAEVKTFD